MSKYKGLFVRGYMGDRNEYPKPAGSKMRCPGSRPGCDLEIHKQEVKEDTNSKIYPITRRIEHMPKGFSYPLTVNFWRNEKPIDGRFKIEINFVAVVPQTSLAYAYGIPLAPELDDRLEGTLLHQRREDIGARVGVRVGSCQHTAEVSTT